MYNRYVNKIHYVAVNIMKNQLIISKNNQDIANTFVEIWQSENTKIVGHIRLKVQRRLRLLMIKPRYSTDDETTDDEMR